MRRHLVIMAREPRMGVAKRRLAADIGHVAAWNFYRRNLKQVLRRLKSPNWDCWLAITPDRATLHHVGWRRHKQGAGDLGARMLKPMLSLPPGPVVALAALLTFNEVGSRSSSS